MSRRPRNCWQQTTKHLAMMRLTTIPRSSPGPQPWFRWSRPTTSRPDCRPTEIVNPFAASFGSTAQGSTDDLRYKLDLCPIESNCPAAQQNSVTDSVTDRRPIQHLEHRTISLLYQPLSICAAIDSHTARLFTRPRCVK